MTDRSPDFDQLAGDDVAGDERERLLRVHELLVRAGPPPELPTAIADPPAPPRPAVATLPRRRTAWVAGIAAAAALALIGFGAGYLVGDRAPEVDFSVVMLGADARASLAVYPKDEAGNWPMRLRVDGLAPGPTYELWLTREGELAAPCGTFVVGRGTTEVPLNAPFELAQFDGWVVVEAGETTPLLTT